MKRIYLVPIALVFIALLTGMTTEQLPPKKNFEKIMWVELELKSDDSVLFQPYSKAWDEWWYSGDQQLYAGATSLMNYALYEQAFNGRKDNLWTLLHPKIIDGSIHLYYPYDPKSYAFGPADDGELRYPLEGYANGETFITSEKMRDEMSYLLGNYGPPGTVPLINEDPNSPEFGEPLIHTDSVTGMQSFVYDPPDFMWYEDKNIVKYRIRVAVIVDKKGNEKKRVIESIGPVVNRRIGDSDEVQEVTKCWMDYNAIRKTLKEGYYFDAAGKPVTFLQHIEDKVAKARL